MLYDLVEFRWDFQKAVFVKYETHKTNIPRKMAYGLKEQLIQQRKSVLLKEEFDKLYRFVVCKNGTYQYINQFKYKKNEKVS